MNKQQAQHFIEQIYSDLTEASYLTRIPTLYHKDVAMKMGEEVVNYEDIVNRAEYRFTHYSVIDNEITDVLVDGDKIAARVCQTATTKNNQLQYLECMMIYQLAEGKVKQAWGTFTPQLHYRVKK